MKRMNVREFRKNISHLADEPIEVVRYSETIGFWTPISLTTEPKKSKPVIKPRTFKTGLTAEEMAELIEKISIAAKMTTEIGDKTR